jgi:hypothetical protein
MIAPVLICASAGMVLFLGSLHLAYTLLTDKFGPREKAVGNTHEARFTSHFRGNHDVEGLDRHPHQSQHGFSALRPDLWLPGPMPMGVAVAVALLDWARIAVARWVHIVGARLLVQGSFDRSLFSHAVLPRRTCWYVCAHKRGERRIVGLDASV